MCPASISPVSWNLPATTVTSRANQVILTGWRVGEVHWGGYAGKARVKADWLVPLPDGLTDKQAMAIGTAGFTSMLCVASLEDHGITPDSGTVLVTGAAGGVGSVAVSILAKRGYTVAGSTGRAEQADYLRSLGASEIIDRTELSEPSKRPLEAEHFAGTVDTVGGNDIGPRPGADNIRRFCCRVRPCRRGRILRARCCRSCCAASIYWVSTR